MNGPDFFAIVAAVMAVILLVDISVLWLLGKQVPELLSQLIFGVFGFYFGRAPGFAKGNGNGNGSGSANGGGHGDGGAQLRGSGTAPVIPAPGQVPPPPVTSGVS